MKNKIINLNKTITLSPLDIVMLEELLAYREDILDNRIKYAELYQTEKAKEEYIEDLNRVEEIKNKLRKD